MRQPTIPERWFETGYSADIPLVILHPNFGDQHLLLPLILNQPDRTPIAFALTAPKSDLPMVWTLLTAILGEQFERRLPELDAQTTSRKAALALLSALKPLGDFTLLIDAFDLADEATVIPWLICMVEKLPTGSQIVLATRRLPTALFEHLPTRQRLAVFPADADRMLLDYTNPPPPDRVLLEVYAHGPGQALVNGRLIEHWDGLLPRSLFFFFIDRGMITRDEIFQTFWSSLSIREATNVFHVTKRKISEILGFDLTVYWSGFYRIAPNIDLQYDVVRFVENIQNAEIAPDAEAIRLLERAIYLYQGTFLNSLDAPWADSRRSELRLSYVDALLGLGRLRERRGENQEALGLYLRAAALQPQREDLARGIMTVYRVLGQRAKALNAYQQLVAELRHHLGVAPDRQTQELVDQIRSEHDSGQK